MRRYVYAGPNEPIFQIAANGTVTYLHHDHLGSVIAQANASGVVGNKYKYSPFGEATSMTGTTIGYTGQRWDNETGLYHYKARYYRPGINRFLQTDPIGYEEDLHLYAYVRNDPMNLTDPEGLVPKSQDDPDPNPNKMPKNVKKTIVLVQNKIEGDATEARAGIQPTGKTAIKDSAGNRTFPDQRLTKANFERKSGSYVRLTDQIKRMLDASALEGKALIIRVNESAKLSKALQAGSLMVDRAALASIV